MHFEISMRKVAPGLQGGPGGGHRRAPLWTPNNSPNRWKRLTCARSFEFRRGETRGTPWSARERELQWRSRRSKRDIPKVFHVLNLSICGTWDNNGGFANAKGKGKEKRNEKSKTSLSSTTTMPPATQPSTLPTIWPRAKPLWCPSLFTALTWLRVIFFVPPTEERAEGKALGVHGEYPSSHYKVPDSSWEASQSRSSRVHCRRGRIVSASVLMQEETISEIFNHLYQSHQ